MLPLVRPHTDESSLVTGRRQVMNDSGRKATTFVFAGYKKEMDEFVQYNAGLESRIKVLRCYFHHSHSSTLAHFACCPFRTQLGP